MEEEQQVESESEEAEAEDSEEAEAEDSAEEAEEAEDSAEEASEEEVRCARYTCETRDAHLPATTPPKISPPCWTPPWCG